MYEISTCLSSSGSLGKNCEQQHQCSHKKMSKGETSPFEVIFCFWNFQPGLCSSDFRSFLHKPSPAPSLPLTADSTGAARAWAQAAAQRQSPPPTPVRTALFQSCLRVQHSAANSSCTPRLYSLRMCRSTVCQLLSQLVTDPQWTKAAQPPRDGQVQMPAVLSDTVKAQILLDRTDLGRVWNSLHLQQPPMVFPLNAWTAAAQIVVSPPSKPKSHKHVQTGP